MVLVDCQVSGSSRCGGKNKPSEYDVLTVREVTDSPEATEGGRHVDVVACRYPPPPQAPNQALVVLGEYMQSRYVHDIQPWEGMWMGDVAGELRVANEDNARLHYHELDLPYLPECRSVIQAGKNFFCPGPRVSVLQPTQLNGSPQFVTEAEACHPLRFLRSDPLHDRLHN